MSWSVYGFEIELFRIRSVDLKFLQFAFWYKLIVKLIQVIVKECKVTFLVVWTILKPFF